MKLWTIRAEQLAAFEEPLHLEFVRRAMQFLRDQFEECRKLPPDELRAFTEKGIAQAQRYSVVTERDTCKFLGLIAALGPDFIERYDWARRILESDRAGITLIVNRLVARALVEMEKKE